ncbi:YncE family protein [Mucilaginibacter aquatilis]|uniref:YncE family protein n=1 Tax=Mucilaginibacter aquatilis TaxID=1517760 RepID=A0A6I4I8L9_9SPHI|nr:DUF5074 domain-containing protein [Mucilaginibacter aquatilis]MVN91605.1 hypothetical protein [Mucilaginibacter aquatilis]
MKIKLLQHNKLICLLLISAIAVLSSCSKNETEPFQKLEVESIAGIYMLSEGSYGAGNGSIAYYNMANKTSEKDYYRKVNGTALGETSNDLQRYGSKMYCVVTGIDGATKSFVDVMDINTCKTIKRISFNSATNGYMPRYIAFYQGKAYVSRYDGKISRIDTATLNVDGELDLKAPYLEGLAVANGKLYVANSDYLLNGVNKVSVVNLNSFTKLSDITVTQNPTKVTAAANGNVYVICQGNYTTVAAQVDVINSLTDTKTTLTTLKGVDYSTSVSIYQNAGVIGLTNTTTFTPDIKVFNAATSTVGNNFITDGTSVGLLYGLTVDPFSGGVVIGDDVSFTSKVWRAYYYDKAGVKKLEFETAVNPKSAVFVYNYKK